MPRLHDVETAVNQIVSGPRLKMKLAGLTGRAVAQAAGLSEQRTSEVTGGTGRAGTFAEKTAIAKVVGCAVDDFPAAPTGVQKVMGDVEIPESVFIPLVLAEAIKRLCKGLDIPARIGERVADRILKAAKIAPSDTGRNPATVQKGAEFTALAREGAATIARLEETAKALTGSEHEPMRLQLATAVLSLKRQFGLE
jgi:hypothetical protein